MIIEFSRNYFYNFCKKKERGYINLKSFEIAKMRDEGMKYLSDGMLFATKIFWYCLDGLLKNISK